MRLEARETRTVDIAAAPCSCNELVDKAAPVKLARKLLKKQGSLSGSKFVRFRSLLEIALARHPETGVRLRPPRRQQYP